MNGHFFGFFFVKILKNVHFFNNRFHRLPGRLEGLDFSGFWGGQMFRFGGKMIEVTAGAVRGKLSVSLISIADFI